MLGAAVLPDEGYRIHDAEFVASVGSHFDGDSLVAQSEIPYGQSYAPACIIAREALALGADAIEGRLESRFPAEGDVHDFFQERNVVGAQSVAPRQEGVGVHALRHEHHLLAFLNCYLCGGAEIVVRIALEKAAFLHIDEYIVDEAGAFIPLSIEGLSLGAERLAIE